MDAQILSSGEYPIRNEEEDPGRGQTTGLHVTLLGTAQHRHVESNSSEVVPLVPSPAGSADAGPELSAGRPTDYLIDEDRIIAACSAPDRCVINDAEDPAIIIKYSDTCVVKFGEVSASEARNQQLAHQILDSSIVRVPEVYHHFTRGSDGYLVMEYIRGSLCGSDLSPEELEKIANAVKHIGRNPSDMITRMPGPVGGGTTKGMLWENEEIEIQDLEDLNKYWNDRLLGQMEPVAFEDSDLTFVHCDVAPRNIIWCRDGTPALLDWAHAGIYPICFERAALQLNTQSGTQVAFSTSLAELLPLNEQEAAQEQKILTGWFNGHRFCIHTRPFVQHAGPPED